MVAVTLSVAEVAPRSRGNEIRRTSQTHEPAEESLEFISALFVKRESQTQLEHALLQWCHSESKFSVVESKDQIKSRCDAPIHFCCI